MDRYWTYGLTAAAVMVATGLGFGQNVSYAQQSTMAGDAFDPNTVSQVSLLPGWTLDNGHYVAAVRFELKPGWKTYWRASDGNGLPPEFDWSASRNIKTVRYIWPTPKVFWVDGVRTIGFEDELIIPVVFEPEQAGPPMEAVVSVDYGACKTVCIPSHGATEATLDPAQTLNQTVIEWWMNHTPRTSQDAGLTPVACHLRPDGQDFVLSAEFAYRSPPNPVEAVLLEGPDPSFWINGIDYALSGDTLSVEAGLMYFGEGAMVMDRDQFRFTILDGDLGIDMRGCATP